jgi:hypothetical protein
MTTLEDLLDAVSDALLAGDLATLSRLAPEVEAATVSAPDQASADRLQRKALRNARLLQAATRGVKAARLRVGEITRGPTLTTYDAQGRKALIASTSREPARRV